MAAFEIEPFELFYLWVWLEDGTRVPLLSIGPEELYRRAFSGRP
jgi:hypothetical protein